MLGGQSQGQSFNLPMADVKGIETRPRSTDIAERSIYR